MEISGYWGRVREGATRPRSLEFGLDSYEKPGRVFSRGGTWLAF